ETLAVAHALIPPRIHEQPPDGLVVLGHDRAKHHGHGVQRSSMRIITAAPGQKLPPPNRVPWSSTSDGRPSQRSIGASANCTSSRCQLHPVFSSAPATMRPIGIRAALPLWAACAAATCPAFVSDTRNVSF